MVLAFLLPVWAYPYIPTQDGPAHLQNGLILRDLLRGDETVRQFYWINWRPLPNWTCFALLAGLSSIFPARVAEKLLVTLYVLGFAGAFRYFAGSLTRDAGVLSLAGFLVVYNRCFWMGFYNYCLSLVLYFVILGYLLRQWDRFRLREAAVLCAVLTLSYFTHLFGFLLAAGSCAWLAVTLPPRSWRKLAYIVGALVPGLVLALAFFRDGQYSGSGFFDNLKEHLSGWLAGSDQWDRLSRDFFNLETELYGIYLDLPLTLGMGLVLLYELFLLAACFTGESAGPGDSARRRAVGALGLVLALLYFVVPDFLVFGKGGFWKARLVMLPALLWLACVRLPNVKGVRYALTAATLVLLGVNLGMVNTFVQSTNRELREFTIGREAAGQSRVLLSSIEGGRQWAVNPMRHAGSYYCLDSGSIQLSPHFTTVSHSPVRLRPGLEEGQGDPASYSMLPLVDTIVIWTDEASPNLPDGFTLAFRNGKLKVARRIPQATDGG